MANKTFYSCRMKWHILLAALAALWVTVYAEEEEEAQERNRDLIKHNKITSVQINSSIYFVGVQNIVKLLKMSHPSKSKQLRHRYLMQKLRTIERTKYVK